MLGRVALMPRRGVSARFLARLAFETQALRYLVPLSPFVAAMFVWPEMALPIAQAPVLMLVAVALVELKLLALAPPARLKAIDEAGAARALDLLRFRGTALLRRIAARRGLTTGELMLVVEQSELARVPPLTVVSVQAGPPGAALLDLDPEERAMIEAELFAAGSDGGLDERSLHRANLRENRFVRTVGFDARGVSAHARLEAALARRAPA